jgi:hypothetical protein
LRRTQTEIGRYFLFANATSIPANASIFVLFAPNNWVIGIISKILNIVETIQGYWKNLNSYDRNSV